MIRFLGLLSQLLLCSAARETDQHDISLVELTAKQQQQNERKLHTTGGETGEWKDGGNQV